MAETLHYSFPILKFDRTPDGDLIVYGKCTDGTVDADHQIVDPKWSAKALEDWLVSGGNMRVQHSPFLYPAGKGLALDIDRDGDSGHWLKALVAKETPAHALVEKRILKDFSIGILDPRVVFDTPTAPGGRICGGEVGEVSLVDRGSNKNTEFQIAKSLGDGGVELVAKMLAMSPMARMALTKGKKKRIKDSGGTDRTDTPEGQFAGPHHSFPVENAGDVSDAASLAHHAADPGAVRSKIKDIAEEKLGMDKDDLPPSLKEGGVCPTCKGKGTIRGGKVDCPDCATKVEAPAVVKGDGGEDYPGDKGDDNESLADYNADQDSDDDDKPAKADKGSPADRSFQKLLRKQRKELKAAARRGDSGGRTPASVEGHLDPDAAEDSPTEVEDKTMIPAGSHRGSETENDVPGTDWEITKSDPSFGLRRLHDAVCPAFQWRDVRREYGIGKSVTSALPVREIQSMAIVAIEKGSVDEAAYLTDILRVIGDIAHLGPDVLIDARKALPEMFPNAHPAQRSDVRPSQFQRGYLSAGHPDLSAGSESGHPSLPAAHVHEVSASDFRRGFLSSGRASASPGEGVQARASTASFGQALNGLEQLHQRVRALWPDMCPITLTSHDYTTGEGHTGIRPGHAPALPAAPGEAAIRKVVKPGTEKALRKSLAKAKRQLAEQAEEIALLGALPDPEQAPYRGLPQLSGPVDRESFVGKALGGADVPEPDDAEFLAFMNGLAANGDPAARMHATKALSALLLK